MRKCIVLLAVMAFVVAFTLPAYAAEWSFYGSARIMSWWEDKDAGDYYFATDDSDMDFVMDTQGNSRVGANVKADDLTGQFELGTGAGANISTRIIWGEYDFGVIKLGVGQHYSPVNIFPSNQVYGGDTDMLPWGGVYSGRNPMVRFRFGGLDVAFLKPNTPLTGEAIAYADVECEDGSLILGECGIAGCTLDTDVSFPKLEGRYRFDMGGLGLELGAGWQKYTVVGLDQDLDEEEEDITSYIIYLGGTYSAGPLSFGGDIWVGQNTGNYGMWETGVDDALVVCDSDGVLEDVEDNNGFGWLGVIGFAASDMLKFEGGYGFVQFDRDDFDTEDETASYYIQAVITLAKGVILVPEIGKVDFKDGPAGGDEGTTTYYGAKWQISF